MSHFTSFLNFFFSISFHVGARKAALSGKLVTPKQPPASPSTALETVETVAEEITKKLLTCPLIRCIIGHEKALPLPAVRPATLPFLYPLSHMQFFFSSLAPVKTRVYGLLLSSRRDCEGLQRRQVQSDRGCIFHLEAVQRSAGRLQAHSSGYGRASKALRKKETRRRA